MKEGKAIIQSEAKTSQLERNAKKKKQEGRLEDRRKSLWDM